MKIILEIEGHGLENFEVQHADSLKELSAFTAKVVKSRTRGPEPRVAVHVIQDGQVLVNVNQLLKLQSKVTVLDWIVDHPEKTFPAILNGLEEMPAKVAWHMGQITGEAIQKRKERGP